MAKQILVTGGAGYIGSHACKQLHAAGYTPISLDNLVYGHAWACQWGPLEQVDLQDEAALEELFDRYDIHAVMHFAAYAYVGESVDEPAKYYQNNVRGTLNLLNAMHKAGVELFVFSSTCATYGEPQYLPLDEEHPQAPINPYGRTKFMIEQVLADYAQAYGLKYVALRYFNAAGADASADIGELHIPETHLIPLVLDAAMGKRSEIRVFGDDYPTEDGTCVRDYIHVSDLADAHVLALQHLEADGQSEVFNLGNGAGFSVKEVIDVARDVTEKPIPVEIAARRAGDPASLIASADKAKRVLGWAPNYPDLKSIIQTAWEWHRRSPES